MPILRAEIAELTTKARSELAKLQQELQKENFITILQTNTVARLKSTAHFLTTNLQALSSRKERLQKCRNDAPFIRDRAKARKALFGCLTDEVESNGKSLALGFSPFSRQCIYKCSVHKTVMISTIEIGCHF